MNCYMLSDERLIAQAAQGDVQAYQELYQRHHQAVLRYAWKFVSNRAAAEEIVQETFWRVWENASTFESERGSFSTWMFSIARNLSISVLRRNNKHDLEALPENGREATEPINQSPRENEVAETAWMSLRFEELRTAIAELPREQQDVVNWIFFQGKTRREIASEQNIPFGTINTRARLALQKLKKSFVD
jgi:RNA polymerase sigma-70 factor (ECF subfamily)